MKPIRAVAAVLLAALAVSCGGDEKPADPTAFADQYCPLFTDCCAQANLRTDGIACRAMVTLVSGGGAYDAEAGMACISGTKAAQANADFCTTGMSVDACNGVFSPASTGGTKQPGETCTEDEECAPAAEGESLCYAVHKWEDGGSSETRTCLVRKDGKAGDKPCVATREGDLTYSQNWDTAWGPVPTTGFLCDMADSLRCDYSTQSCVALKNVGETCLGSSDCVRTAYCKYPTCTARLPAGSTCASDEECDPTTWCESASKKCTERLASGSSCTFSDQCQEGLSCINRACGASGSMGLAFLCGS